MKPNSVLNVGNIIMKNTIVKCLTLTFKKKEDIKNYMICYNEYWVGLCITGNPRRI